MVHRVRIAIAVVALTVTSALCPTRCIWVEAAVQKPPTCHRHGGTAPGRRSMPATCCESLVALAPSSTSFSLAPPLLAAGLFAPPLGITTRHSLQSTVLAPGHEGPPPRLYLLRHAFLI